MVIIGKIPSKIYFQRVACFWQPEKWLFPDQLYHTKHHNLTTKTPRLATHFCKKPNKNTTPPQTQKNAARQRRTAFLTPQITR
jgi:hypothetical protein